MSSSQTGYAHAGTAAEGLATQLQRAADEIASRADEHDRDASFPDDGIAALWRADLGNLTMTAEAACRRARRLACQDPAARTSGD